MKLTQRVRLATLAVVAAGTTWLGACSDSPTAPGIQPQIVNQPGNFEYQVSDVQGFSGSLSYTWQNSGNQANVNQATTISGGSVTLQIFDAAQTQVYTRSLADNGTFVTTAGQPGGWTVRIVYAAAVAPVVNFRAQTP
ncbi:MAG TPA: hypothetical protein VFZ87_13775 [Gemmatimonadales bacterium]